MEHFRVLRNSLPIMCLIFVIYIILILNDTNTQKSYRRGLSGDGKGCATQISKWNCEVVSTIVEFPQCMFYVPNALVD